jgi:uncharacterized protein
MKPVQMLNTKVADVELLDRCKRAIRGVVPDADVILYGSRARGDAHEYSDYDILILVDDTVDITLETKLVDQILPFELESGAVLTLITYNKKQWNTPLYRAMPFHENVDRDGVLL